jgi:HK97 family phage prohead protease
MTVYRALGHVDRAATRGDGPLRVVMATEGRKPDGIDLRMSGAKLDRFRANPVLGYGHNYYGRGDLPIGRVTGASIVVEGSQLSGDLEFDLGDDFAREVERKMRDGFLSAVSIGFSVTRWEDPKSSYWTGGVAEEWELSELSVVPIGMDSKALVSSGRSLGGPHGHLLRALVDEFGLDAIVTACRRIDGDTTQEPQAPADPAPAAPAIDPTAARDLLAAFTIQGVS